MKKVNYQKKLLRNPVKDDIKGIVIRDDDPGGSVSLDRKEFNKSKKTTFRIPEMKTPSVNSIQESSKSVASNLDYPSVQSTLNIGKKIDKLEKMKKPSFKTTLDTRVNEKVTKQVNFPYEKRIFKDLMPLSSPNRRHPTPSIVSRPPIPPKDKEPNLEDFIEIKEIQEYVHVPSIEIKRKQTRSRSPSSHLYKMLWFYDKINRFD